MITALSILNEYFRVIFLGCILPGYIVRGCNVVLIFRTFNLWLVQNMESRIYRREIMAT